MADSIIHHSIGLFQIMVGAVCLIVLGAVIRQARKPRGRRYHYHG